MAKEKRYVSDNAQLMAEWHWEKNRGNGLEPWAITYGSAKKIWWKCAAGHEWEASPNHRSRGRQCPVCARRSGAINLSKNKLANNGSLADINPAVAVQWHPFKNGFLSAKDVTASNGRKVWWICPKGHEWEAVIKSRTRGAGCPICSGHKVLVGFNDLATICPDLARQWHPRKNGNLTPYDITTGNDRCVWWICNKGHEWKAKVSNRKNGCGCPICAGKQVLVGFNDLASVSPEIAAEWHPIKNGKLTPQDVVAKSNKKIWWQCSKGHEWSTSPSHRSRGQHCPQCFGESKTSFPEQAIYYYLKQETTAHNRYRIDNKTEIDVFLPEYCIGIEYDGIRYHGRPSEKLRDLQKQEKLSENGILLIRVKETDDLPSPTFEGNVLLIKPGASHDVLSQAIGMLVSLINQYAGAFLQIDIDVARDRSKIYDQYVAIEKANSLVAINPQLAAQWHPTKNKSMLPEHVSASSNKHAWWVCEHGHEWSAVINSRNQGAGCPYCAGYLPIVGVNDLSTILPDLAKQWHPIKNKTLTPQDVTASSNKKVWWQCEMGHEWRTEVYHRKKGGNCPICSGRQVLVGFNDLATKKPQLAAQWHPSKNGELQPTDISPGSDKRVWWICPKNHEWEAIVSSRSSGVGCPYCSNQRVLAGYNDLATTVPALAKEWHPTKNNNLHPTDVTRCSNKKVWWMCSACGHEWQASVNHRHKSQKCPQCKRKIDDESSLA